MASFPIGKDDDTRPLLADDTRDLQPVLPGVLDASVWNVERLPPAHFQNLCRSFGFARAVLRRAARPQLALSQVEDAGRVAQARHLQESAATGLLHVVT